MAQLRESIDRYEVVEIIGRGAMGVVYRARDPVIGRIVALKTIDLPKDLAGEQRADALERFEREARAAGLLSHPNIVTIYDAGKAGIEASPYIAMEFVEGRNLRQMVPPKEKLPADETLEIAMQVARALDYAHRRGIIHRDVKPANILVRDDGLVKLADFGVARMEASDLTRTGQSVGSPSYIAPEMLKNGPVDGRADLFSLGVILYELLTGEKPFKGENLDALYRAILSQPPERPSSREPSLAPSWETILERLLAKSPAERYSDAARLLEDLRALQLGKPLATDEEAETPSVSPVPEPIVDRSPDGTRPVFRGSSTSGAGHMSPQRKALVALLTVSGFCGGVALLALMTARPWRTTKQETAEAGIARETTLAPAAADLTMRLAHSLKAGNISLAVDGRTLISAPFRGEWSKMKVQGTLSRRVQVPAGRHEFTVTVLNEEGRQWTGSTTREIGGGEDPVLFVEVKGFLKKNLDLTWY